MNLINIIKSYFVQGQERSVLAKKNIVYLFFIRILSILVSFLLVPIALNYVRAETYGIWLTISSMVGWISLFDIGINNGLKNKLTEVLSKKEYFEAKSYVSTTYILLALIFIPIFIIFVVINNFIYWPDLLNCSDQFAGELSKVLIIVFGYFCLRFIFSTINIILMSNQTPAEASARGLIEQIATLSVIYILTYFTKGSLYNLSLCFCIVPIIVLLLNNIILFRGKFKELRPSIKFFGIKYTKKIFSLGIKFFLIQLAGVIQFQTANIIIIKSFGPEDVTVYNIAFKYFSIITMLMTIVIAPLWSSVTDAYHLGDRKWIINVTKKYQYFAFFLIGIGIIMLLISNQIYELWVGKNIVYIPFNISFWMFILSSAMAFGSIFVGVLNGISALRIQFFASLISPFIFVLICYILIKYLYFGISAVIIASIISNFNGFILAPVQFYKIFIKKSKNPIWYAS